MALVTNPIPVVWSPDTRRHEPRHEVWVGVPTDGSEVPGRVDAILAGLGERPRVLAAPHDDALLLGVHDESLVTWLRTCHERWLAGPYDELVGQQQVVPYFFPTPALSQGMPMHRPAAVHGEAGGFCYDTMTLVGPGTWPAARAAVDAALTAVDLVVAGAGAAYALCRPPGHHVTRAGYGGSCYLNNAAMAAQGLRDAGHERVGVLDVDAHHGNGTQAIFWDRADVGYASLHVDPGAGWFPHVFGYADERGAGAGLGTTRNEPLAEGTADDVWTETAAGLVDWLERLGCTALVVSLGVDAAADDPESPLQVTTDGYRAAGAAVGATGLPVVAVQEGGYHLDTLGALVDAFLTGLGGGAGSRR